MHKLEALLKRLDNLATSLERDKRWKEAYDVRTAIAALEHTGR